MSIQPDNVASVKKHQSQREYHGHASKGKLSATYKSWRSMRKRCFAKPGTHHGNRYSARGIQVCEEWTEFSVFLSDMGEKPDGYTLERINNDCGYNKKNCRWATTYDQVRNRSTNVHVEFQGQSMILKDAARMAGMNYQRVVRRINAGWSVEKALTTPTRKCARQNQ